MGGKFSAGKWDDDSVSYLSNDKLTEPKVALSGKVLAVLALMLLTLFSILFVHIPVVDAAVFTVVTDKATYSPGDQVMIRGSATSNALIALQVDDPKGTTILLASLSADQSGNFSRVFRLPIDASEGSYRISVSHGDTVRTASFTVFAKPLEFVLKILPDKGVYSDEVLTIKTVANKQLRTDPAVTVQQSKLAPFTVELTRTATNEWMGTYAVVSGADGSAKIEVVGEDLLGNRGTASKMISIDTTPPVVTITAPSTSFDATINLSGTVNDRSVDNVQLQVDALPPSRIPVSNQAWTAQVTLITAGTHTLTVTARDEAGNQGIASTTTTLSIVTGPLALDLEVPIRTVPGASITIWLQTASEGKPVTPTNLSGTVIQPDGTEVSLEFSSVKAGLAQAKYFPAKEGEYTVTAEASWKGVNGVALKTFRAEPQSQLPQILNNGLAEVNDGLAGVKAQITTARSDINNLLTLLTIAIAFSLVAAAAAIIAVIQIVRTVVLK